jgi:hypothetical protein
MEEFAKEALNLAFPKFHMLLNYASNELYRYSADVLTINECSALALQHLRHTYFLPYLNGLSELLYQYAVCKPLTRQRAINAYLSMPIIKEYKDTPEFQKWLKIERAKKQAMRQSSLHNEEREEKQLKSEQEKTKQLANKDKKEAKELRAQRRRIETTREREQQNQRINQIETRLSGITQLQLTQLETRIDSISKDFGEFQQRKEQTHNDLLALKTFIEQRDRQALEYFGKLIEEGKQANVQELKKALAEYAGTYQQLAIQCETLTTQTREALEHQNKAIENARETLALEYERKTEKKIADLAIQFEAQQAEQIKVLALGYDKARIEAEETIKAELNTQIETVRQNNKLTTDNQQKEITRLRHQYEEEMRDKLQAITDRQEQAREKAMVETRILIGVKVEEIRNTQKQELTKQTAQIRDELDKQQTDTLALLGEVQELKENTDRRIDVLGRAPIQEVMPSEYIAELGRLHDLIAQQGNILRTMREQNEQDENKIKQYQQMAQLWADNLGISDANCIADIKARIEELFIIGTKPEHIKLFLAEFQKQFKTLLANHNEVMAYAKAYQATRKTTDEIKQRSKKPALTFDTHMDYIKKYFREQLTMIYEPDTELYHDLCEWTDAHIENLAQNGTNITVIGGKIRDLPQRFRYFLDSIGEPFYWQAWARAWSDETMDPAQNPTMESEIIDIINSPDNAPEEVRRIKKDFADYVKAKNITNQTDYINAINIYIDMLWHNIHKVDVIFVAIKHLKAKINENLKHQTFNQAYKMSFAEVFAEIEELGGIVGSFEHWASNDLFPDLRPRFRFPAEYMAQVIQRIGTLYEMGISTTIIRRIIENFKTQIRRYTQSEGLDEAFKRASQEITKQAKANIKSFDNGTEQAQRIEDEAEEMAHREADYQQWRAWHDTEQQKVKDEEEQGREENAKIWAMNVEATRRYQQAQSDRITQRQDYINIYAKNLYEISKHTPIGTIWTEQDAKDIAQKEFSEYVPSEWDGRFIEFDNFPTFQALAEESGKYDELIHSYGKTHEQAMGILIERREAIEQHAVNVYEQHLRDEHTRDFWENGLPKVILYNPENQQINIVLENALNWCYFIAFYRQGLNGEVIECDTFNTEANGYFELGKERRELDKVGYPIDISQFSDMEMATYGKAMAWMVKVGLVPSDVIDLLKQTDRFKDEYVQGQNSILQNEECIIVDEFGVYHSVIMEWMAQFAIRIPDDMFNVLSELPEDIQTQYDTYERRKAWRVEAHTRHDFYENQETGQLSYKYIDFQGLEPEILDKEIERLAYLFCILRPHNIDDPMTDFGQASSGPFLDGFCWFLLEEKDEYFRQDWVDAIWWQWTYLEAGHYITYMNGEYPPLPKPIHEAPFDFYLRRDRIDANPLMKPILARYIAELKAGKWLNIITNDQTHNQILADRCLRYDDMIRSVREDVETNKQRRQKETEDNEQRQRKIAENQERLKHRNATTNRTGAKQTRERGTQILSQIERLKGVGLTRNGIYCYANALFQVLAHIPDFAITDLPLSCQLGDLIRAIFQSQSTVPLSFVHSILETLTDYYPRRWNLKEQQDPHELFILLAQKVYPSMGRLFTFWINHFSKGVEIMTPDTFLSLPIEPKGGIASAFRSEENPAYGLVERRIQELPAVFMFQVNRFKRGDNAKDSTPINLPTEYNFEQHMTLGAPNNYKLYATINHDGPTRKSGHYIAMININMSTYWFLFDDSKVSRVSTQADFNKLCSNAYLVFYVHADLIGSLFPDSD